MTIINAVHFSKAAITKKFEIFLHQIFEKYKEAIIKICW